MFDRSFAYLIYFCYNIAFQSENLKGKIVQLFRKFFLVLVSLAIVLALYLLLWPVRIDPAAWHPPKAPPLTGVYAVNDGLAAVERIEIAGGNGPEDVAVDSLGRIYGGLQNGKIVRVQADGSGEEIFADTQGRPLGLQFDRQGNLIVADGYKGLLSINPAGEITVLSTGVNGVPFGFTDDVDIAKNGVIYFSDASWKFSQEGYQMDALEHRPNGRLLAYDPASKKTTVLLDSLYFANGIAVSPDQTFVLVNETWEYRIRRYWLRGEKAGASDIFIANLPGFPDGVSCNGKDTFWVALASPRQKIVDALADKPFLRKVVARLPKFVQPDALHYGFLLGLDVNGNVKFNLQSPSGKPFAVVTSVQQEGDVLFLGSLFEKAIGKLPVPH